MPFKHVANQILSPRHTSYHMLTTIFASYLWTQDERCNASLASTKLHTSGALSPDIYRLFRIQFSAFICRQWRAPLGMQQSWLLTVNNWDVDKNSILRKSKGPNVAQLEHELSPSVRAKSRKTKAAWSIRPRKNRSDCDRFVTNPMAVCNQYSFDKKSGVKLC
jgi:hypothetical protein